MLPLAFRTLFDLVFKARDNHAKDSGIDKRNIFSFKEKMFLIRPINVHIFVFYFWNFK